MAVSPTARPTAEAARGDAVRALLAAGVMAGVLALVGTESLSALEWLVGLPVAGAAFVAALLATRELSPGEIRALSDCLSGLFAVADASTTLIG